MIKDRIIPFRVSKEEHQAITDFLKERGITKRSPFLREAILAYINSDKPDLTREKLAEFRFMRKQFANVGNNLNQVVYRLNAGLPVSTPKIEAMQEELKRTFKELVFFYRGIERELR